ncbi:MAG: 23S rRNA (guanosine(2251)-2'-O)-methyltransferase RlmB [Cyanobacteriota bacterium]
MSSRFDRLPEKRSGDGAGRTPGKPSRFGAPRAGGERPDWRRDTDDTGPGERGGDRPGRPARRPFGDRARPGGGGERPFSARPRVERPSSERAFTPRRTGERPVFGARRPGERPGGARPAFGERPAFGARRSVDRSSAGDRPGLDRGAAPRSFGERPQTDRFPRRPGGLAGGRPAFRPGAEGERRPFERSGERRSFDRSGDRFPARVAGRFGSRPSGGDRAFDRAPRNEPIVEVPPEADRFGQAPSDDLIWGRHPALAALESGRPVHRIWCTPEMRFSPKFLQLLREAKSAGVLVEEVTWARLGQITGGAVHQGIVLQTAAAETLDLPSLIDGCRDLGEPPLLMAVDGLTDPHNLGAIVRSAESLGAHGLVLPQRRSAGLTGTVAKVAAGALEHLPVARVVNLNRALDTLKQEGYRVIGLAEEGTVGLHEADLDGPLVVVTGSEGSGLSLLTRKTCDQLIRIPLRGATPSLNASVATALMLYEIARRGWMKSLSGTAPAPRIVRPQLPAPTARVQAPEAFPEALEASSSEASPPPAVAPLAEESAAADVAADQPDEVSVASDEAVDGSVDAAGIAPADVPSLEPSGSEAATVDPSATSEEFGSAVSGHPDPSAPDHPSADSDPLADHQAPQAAESGGVAPEPSVSTTEGTLELSLATPVPTPVFQANIQL